MVEGLTSRPLSAGLPRGQGGEMSREICPLARHAGLGARMRNGRCEASPAASCLSCEKVRSVGMRARRKCQEANAATTAPNLAVSPFTVNRGTGTTGTGTGFDYRYRSWSRSRSQYPMAGTTAAGNIGIQDPTNPE